MTDKLTKGTTVRVEFEGEVLYVDNLGDGLIDIKLGDNKYATVRESDCTVINPPGPVFKDGDLAITLAHGIAVQRHDRRWYFVGLDETHSRTDEEAEKYVMQGYWKMVSVDE